MAFRLIGLFLLSDASLCVVGPLPLSLMELQHFFPSLRLGVRDHPLQLPVTLRKSVSMQLIYSVSSAPLTTALMQDF